MGHDERAMELFGQGYNCAQAVFAAYCEQTGMDPETAVRLASSFGGGMGRMREVCGALTGVFMVAGLLYGYDKPGDDTVKAAHYDRIQQLAAAFRERTGSILCRELLALPPGPDSPVPAPRTADYYTLRPCKELVGIAAQVLDEYMDRHPNK